MVPRQRRVGRERSRGTVMVLFAMITVVLLGMLALVIELGTVRVGRERMQAASDAAALEVLRERDYVRPSLGTEDAAVRDHDRRSRNRLMASWPFAGENLVQAYANSVEGAGSYVTLDTQVDPGNNALNRGLVLGQAGSSIPFLQTNYMGDVGLGSGVNAKYGDIVSGSFTGHDPGAQIGYDGNPIRREQSGYDRVDFTPADPGSAPFADSVLVRMRRTRPYGQSSTSPWSGLDEQASVSSTGYTMPLLFGLGTLFSSQNPADGYSVRHHGIPLRSTSIAQARPAVRVGEARPDLGVQWAVGAAPISMDYREWIYDGGSWSYDPNTRESSIVIRVRPDNYEYVVPLHDSLVWGSLRTPAASQVGDEVELDELTPNPLPDGTDGNFDPEFWSRTECYVPLFFPVPTGPNGQAERRVCGFGRVRIEPGEEPPNAPPDSEEGDIFILVTKLANTRSPEQPWMAPRNASAVFDGEQPSIVYPSNPTRDWEDLIGWLHELPAPIPNSSEPGGVASFNPHVPEARVYAPALVR